MQSVFPFANVPGDLASYDTQYLRRRSTNVIIQEAATRRYLSEKGVWIPDIKQAMTFQSGSKAVEHVKRLKLSNVHLILTRDIRASEVIPVDSLLR